MKGSHPLLPLARALATSLGGGRAANRRVAGIGLKWIGTIDENLSSRDPADFIVFLAVPPRYLREQHLRRASAALVEARLA